MLSKMDAFLVRVHACVTNLCHQDDDWSSGEQWGMPLSISPVH